MSLKSDWRKRLRRGAGGLLLFLLPLPLLLDALLALWGGDLGEFAGSAGAGALLLGAALACRRGIHEEVASAGRPFASRRGRTLKIVGGVLTAFGTFAAALFAAGHGIGIAAVFAAVAAFGYVLLYGGADEVQALPQGAIADELQPILSEAYARLERIEGIRRAVGSREFETRLGNIVTGSERILEHVAQDPRDLRRARKFLTVYLDGAERVVQQYARTHSDAGSAELEHSFRTLLVEMENTCNEQYETLLRHDVLDLDVQIEVLSTRLRREGVG